ncbi:Gas vesicle synthesis protein GvpO [Marinococcus luteus]|uniref:Gas vesicle synthesis protein GvpO n=1 Tax=Marinococcus luteus TaxID=1122204 RepID=A0A1H2UP38_9BACI|nr:gas vesicle protein GvpO [Marinococcus luteus]SDW57845.1 Gas vesicle synthesis protein GvpO [Marinococcus luteus]
MTAKQSTTKTEEKTNETQGQELKTSKSGSYKPFSSEEEGEEQPKEQIKGPAKSGSSSETSQKSSGQNEKTDDKGESDEVNNTTATTSKKNTAKSQQTKKESTEEAAQQEGSDEASFAPIKSDMFETIRSFFGETMNSPVRVTAIMDAGDGWNIEVELVEEKEYTQKYGRDQLIGIYEAKMNKDQKITSYQRMNTRARSVPFEKKER